MSNALRSSLDRLAAEFAEAVLEAIQGSSLPDILDGGGSLQPSEVPDGRDEDLERGSLNWEQMRTLLTDRHRALLLADIELSARIRGFAERKKLRTLGELARCSSEHLATARNLGRKSIAELPLAVSAHLRSLEAADLSSDGLLECFGSVVSGLGPTEGVIARRRSGLGVDPMTLKQVGQILGVSRERVRQVEAEMCQQLARQPWAKGVRRRVEAVLDEGVFPLDALAEDPWWKAAVAQPLVVGFVIDTLLQTGAVVVEMDDRHWLSRHKPAVLTTAWSALLSAAQAVPLPAPFRSFEPLIKDVGARFGRHLADHFREGLRALMRLDAGGRESAERVLAVGDTQGAWILATLRAAAEPMRIEDLAKPFGRSRLGNLPEEVLFFGHGTVGLRKHFPDFEQWQARLVPDCIRLVKELGPERQWYCGELLDELRKERDIPGWMTAFGLSELIKADGTLRYLGRLRVALGDGAEGNTRIFLRDAVSEILAAAGAPMLRGKILEKLAKHVGMSEYGHTVLTHPQFVRVDADRIGLLARDVPGGLKAIAEAGDHVERVLVRRDRGLAERLAHKEVAGLSRKHATWSPELAGSVLRSDGRFRFDSSDTVGLAIWDSTRVPTRIEIAEGALAKARGRVRVETVMAQFEEHYGVRPSRGYLISLAWRVGAGVDGEWIIGKDKARR